MEARVPTQQADESRPAAVALRATCWVLTAAALVLAVWNANQYHVTRALALFSAFYLVAPLGIGLGVARLAGLDRRRSGVLLFPVAAGWAGSAALATAVVYLGAQRFAFGALVVAGLAGWAAFVLGEGRRPSERLRAAVGSTDLAAEALIAALTFATYSGAKASAFLIRHDGMQLQRQYFDLTYHLAFIKRGIAAGLPIHDYPLIASFSRLSYHPAFDTLSTVVLRGLHLPVDASYFGVILPMTFAAFTIALIAAARAWSGQLRGAVLAAAVVLLALLAGLLSAGVVKTLGSFSFNQMRWFIISAPGALGGTLVLVVLAMLAGPERLRLRTLLVAGTAIGVLLCAKAQMGVVALPAYLGTLVTLAAMERVSWRDAALGSLGAVVVGGLAYLTTLGDGGGWIRVEFGAMAHWVTTAETGTVTSPLVAAMAHAFRYNLVTAIAALLFFIFVATPGWPLLVAAIALPAARAGDRDPLRASSAPVFIGWICAAVLGVSLTLVQHGPNVYLPWQIALHAIALMWPLAAVSAAVLVDAALPPRLRLAEGFARPLRVAAPALVVVVALVVATSGARAMVRARLVGWTKAPSAFVMLVRRLPQLTPAQAVVAQDVDLDSDAWVAGVGGRRAYAERLQSPELTRGQAPRLRATIAALYSAADASEAAGILRREGIDYVIVETSALRPGLALATAQVATQGDFELRRTRR